MSAETLRDAVDSALADDFLTDAVVKAVAPVVEFEHLNALRELSNRLFRADVELGRVKHQTERIVGKAEGVRLAQSYVDEAVRAAEAILGEAGR